MIAAARDGPPQTVLEPGEDHSVEALMVDWCATSIEDCRGSRDAMFDEGRFVLVVAWLSDGREVRSHAFSVPLE